MEGGTEEDKKANDFLVAIVFLASWLFVGSAKNDTAAEPIKIGAILNFTGPVADLGPKFKAGIELALEEAGYKVTIREVTEYIEVFYNRRRRQARLGHLPRLSMSDSSMQGRLQHGRTFQISFLLHKELRHLLYSHGSCFFKFLDNGSESTGIRI